MGCIWQWQVSIVAICQHINRNSHLSTVQESILIFDTGSKHRNVFNVFRQQENLLIFSLHAASRCFISHNAVHSIILSRSVQIARFYSQRMRCTDTPPHPQYRTLYCCYTGAVRCLTIATAHCCTRPDVFRTFGSPSEASWTVNGNRRELLQTTGYGDIQYRHWNTGLQVHHRLRSGTAYRRYSCRLRSVTAYRWYSRRLRSVTAYRQYSCRNLRTNLRNPLMISERFEICRP
jgi:hypothetical protein